MSSFQRLHRLFQGAALASLAGACGGAEAPPAVDKAGFTQLCEGQTYNALQGLTAAPPVDYIELRSAPGVSTGEGTLCKSAADATKCKAAFASLTATGWSLGGQAQVSQYLAYSRGDEVGVVDTIDKVTKFLAPIDTAKDAAFVLSLQRHRINCDGPNVRPASSGLGFDLVTLTGSGCGAGDDIREHVMNVSPTGVVTEISSVLRTAGNPNCAIGRRPEGLVPHEGDGRGLADFLCEMTHLEAASVHAFDRLARELVVHVAPRRLVRAALRAKRDEIRHAKMAAKLAKRAGGETRAPQVPELGVRDLFAIAMENAIEGCVAETFGALLAEVQWRRAGDQALAGALRIIARDETRHAALAWDVAGWLEPRLTPEQRAQVAEGAPTRGPRAPGELRRRALGRGPHARRNAFGARGAVAHGFRGRSAVGRVSA